MIVKFIEETEPMSLINGKEYKVENIDEDGFYEILDESGEVYCYFPESFEIIEQ